MTPEQKPEFLEIIAGLAELQGRELSPAALKIWWRSMRHWDLDEFKRAATYLARASEFMPKPKHFDRLRANAAMNRHEAWVIAVAHASGGHRTGATVDPIVAEAVQRMGGFSVIGQCREDRLEWLKRDFIEFYDTVVDEKVAAAALPVCLPGERSKYLRRDESRPALGVST